MMQVYMDDKHIGNIHKDIDPRSGFFKVSKMEEPDFDAPFDETLDQRMSVIEIPVGRMQRRVSERQLTMSRLTPEEIMRMEGIPPNAEKIRNEASMDYIFRWSVLGVTKDQYEEIFDLDYFEPV